MFDVVVVGADGSKTAERAVVAATEMAKMSGGTLHIVTAYDRKVRTDSSLPSEFRRQDNESEIEALQQVLSFIPKERGVKCQVHQVAGDPAEAVINMAIELHADLIVVGNQGMRGARRVLGSVPNSVAHGAPCSVAIIDTSE